MAAEGNCKPIWLFLTPEHAAASMTALPAPFITLQLRTAFTAKGMKWERSAIPYLLLCSKAAALQWKDWTASGHGDPRWGEGNSPRQEFPLPRAWLAHSLPAAPSRDEGKGRFWGYEFMGWYPTSGSCWRPSLFLLKQIINWALRSWIPN